MGSTQAATLDGGCFWCVEAAFKEFGSVSEVTSDYAGGEMEDPSYEQVYSGSTGHAEIVQVDYSPVVVGYDELLDVFFAVHNPIQLNRQGPDVGAQHHSIAPFHDDEQKRQALVYIDALDEEYDDEVVTELAPFETFCEAEEHRQDYFEKANAADGNTNDVYCQLNVVPKIEKVREKFADKMKAETEPDA